MKNGLILSAAVAALAGCASNAPMTTDKSLSLVKPAAQADQVELEAGQQALPEKQATAKAGEMKPVLVMQDGVNSAQAAYISGKQALGNGKLEMARANFEKARNLNPKLVDAFVGLGAVFSLTGRHDRAVVAFGKAVSLEPDNANWHANLGMAHARNGEFAQAQQLLAKAWSLDPDNSRIEAQLTRVTSVAKANGQATPVVAPVAVPVAMKAPEVAASPLKQVGERVFTLSLGGSAPAVSDTDESANAKSANSVPLVKAAAETSENNPAAQPDVSVSAPALPAIKVARANLAARIAKSKAADSAETMSEQKKDIEPVKVAVATEPSPKDVVKKETVASKPVIEHATDKGPVAVAETVKKPTMPLQIPQVQKAVTKSVAQAPMVKSVAKLPMVSKPVTLKEPKAVSKPVTKKVVAKKAVEKKAVAKKAVAKKAVAKKVVAKKVVAKKVVAKKVVAKKVVAKKVVAKKPVLVRSVRGMVIVAASSTIASKVSTHLALKGLRAEKIAKPNASLVPLTEIHYRTGYEADVAAVTKALPVRAYPIELSGLPAGVNIKVVVGRDMKRAQL